MPHVSAPATVPGPYDPVMARLRAARPDVEPATAALLAEEGPAILARVLGSPRTLTCTERPAAGLRSPGEGTPTMWRPVAEATRRAFSLYRPLARRVVLAGTVAAVVLAATAGLLVSDPTAPAAFASWTAMPRTAPGASPSQDDLVAWASQCTDLTGFSVSLGGVSARDAEAAGRSVLVDRRGGYTFCVDFSPGESTDADPLTATASLKGDDAQGGAVTAYDEPVELPRGGDVLVLGGDLQDPPLGDGDADVDHGHDFFLVYGIAGDAVTGVDLVLASGLCITTTVHEGVWGAWWPATEGAATDSTLVVRTDGGAQEVDPDLVGLDWDR